MLLCILIRIVALYRHVALYAIFYAGLIHALALHTTQHSFSLPTRTARALYRVNQPDYRQNQYTTPSSSRASLSTI
jgi:hypothetical protein